MPEVMSRWSRELIEEPLTHATLATVSADGSPHQAVLWYLVAGDDVLVNSKRGRVWPANLERDGRFSLYVGGAHDWITLRGRAEVLEDRAQAVEDICDMARSYHRHEPEVAERAIKTFRGQDRISFLLHPDAITEHPAG